jgi:hypothetical protein
MATKKEKQYIKDARTTISYLERMGVQITGIAISCGKKLTKDEVAALTVVASEIKKYHI